MDEECCPELWVGGKGEEMSSRDSGGHDLRNNLEVNGKKNIYKGNENFWKS